MANSRLCADGNVKKEYTKEDIDYIAIYFNNWIYLFSPELASRSFTVRINKPKNLQHNQHWIEDYRIDKILNITINDWTSLKEETRKQQGTDKSRKYQCIDCGTPVWQKNSRCVICERKIRSNKSNKPTREVLKEEIKNTPFTTIASKYGVTDNAVRKWCKSYNLPFRVADIKQIQKEGGWNQI